VLASQVRPAGPRPGAVASRAVRAGGRARPAHAAPHHPSRGGGALHRRPRHGAHLARRLPSGQDRGGGHGRHVGRDGHRARHAGRTGRGPERHPDGPAHAGARLQLQHARREPGDDRLHRDPDPRCPCPRHRPLGRGAGHRGEGWREPREWRHLRCDRPPGRDRRSPPRRRGGRPRPRRAVCRGRRSGPGRARLDQRIHGLHAAHAHVRRPRRRRAGGGRPHRARRGEHGHQRHRDLRHRV
ncbi:MAG: hypothetical protein AVDCRST_MAG15-3176, partial [uncultured Rubellimicrobium sp.]